MIKKEILSAVEKAIKKIAGNHGSKDLEMPQFTVEAPPENIKADYATNVALMLSSKLGQSPMQIAGEIAGELNLPPTNVSQHLRIMRNLGTVKARKYGTKVYYSISSKKFSEGYRLIREGLAELHFSKSEVLFPEDQEKPRKK